MSAGSRQLKINIIGDSKSAEQAFASVEKSADGLGSKIGTVGKVAGAAFLGIGAAAAGAFVVGAKGALDQEQALDKLQAQLGLTAEEADEMGEVARNVFEGAWGDSVPGVMESIQTIRTALGDMSSEELQGLTEKFLTIEDLWAAPVEETARTVSTLTKNFKDLSEEQALDLITTGFQEGGDVGGELLDTLNEYAPAFSNIGLSADQFLGTLIAGSEAGAFSVDKVGDAMKEFEIRGQDASAATNEAFESMGLNAEEMGQAIASGGEAGERAFQASLAALAAMEDPVARNAAGVALFGSQWEDVGEDVVLAMAEGIEGIEGFEGATERAGDAAYDNLGTMWESFKRQAMGALTDAVTPAVLALAEGIQRIGKAFQEGGISGALSEIGKIGGEIWDSIAGLDWNGIAGTIIDGLMTGLSAAGDMTASIASWLWDSFKGLDFTGIGETLVSGLLAGARAVGNFATDIGTWLWDTFTGIQWTDIGMSIVDGLLSGIAAVADAGSRILEWLSGQLTSVDWSGLGMTVVDGLLAGITAVVDAGERVLGWLSGQLTSVDWTGLGTTVVDGLMAGITAVQDFGERFIAWFQSGIQGGDWSGIGQSISGQLSGAMSAIQDVSAFQPIIDFFNNSLMPAFQTIAGEISTRVTPTINMLRDSFGEVGTIISTNLGPTLTNLKEMWTQLQPVLTVVATIIGGVLLAALSGLAGLMSGVLPNAFNAAFAVINGLIGIVTGLAQTVTGVVQIIKGILTGDWALAWKGAQNVVEGMVGAITSLFSGLWGALKGFIMAVVDGIIGLFQGLYNTVVGNSIIPDMINGIIEWFMRLPGELIALVSGWVTDTLGFFSDLHADAVRIISDTVTSIIGFLADLVADGAVKAGEFVTGVIDKLIELFVQGPGRIYDFVVAGVEEIAKLAVRGAEEAGKLPGAVLEAIGDLGSTLLQTGKDLVSGLIQGIKESLPSLSDVAGSITGTITDGLGKLPGLSPSPLGIEIGQQFGDGLVVGMQDRIPQVEVSAAELAAAVVEGVQNDVGRLPELLEDTGVAFAVELDKMRIAAEESLILARVRGDSEEEIAKLEADLETMRMILDAWVADTGNTIEEAHIFALSNEQREQALADQQALLEAQKAAALDAYQGYMNDLEGIASGETMQRLEERLTDVLGMKRAAEEIGNNDLAKLYAKEVETILRDMEIVGEIAGTAVAQGMAAKMVPEIKRMSEEGIAELERVFSKTPEIGVKFVEDMIRAVQDGELAYEDAMRLFAMIPAEILEPELERLGETYQTDYVKAVIDGTDEMIDSQTGLIGVLDQVSAGFAATAKEAGNYAEVVSRAGAKTADEWNAAAEAALNNQSTTGGATGTGSGNSLTADSWFTPERIAQWQQRIEDNMRALTNRFISDDLREKAMRSIEQAQSSLSEAASLGYIQSAPTPINITVVNDQPIMWNGQQIGKLVSDYQGQQYKGQL